MKHIMWLYLLYLLLFSGCASAPKQVLHCYSGAELPDSSVSVIEIGYANYLIIDGMYYADRMEHSSVRLLPGEHKLKWSTTIRVSNFSDAHELVKFEKVVLEAGHTYRIFADRTTVGDRTFTWLGDVRTGKVVAGRKKP